MEKEKNKNKNMYVLAVVALLLVLIVGYAALQSQLTINGTTTVSKNTWDIHFENIVPNANNSIIPETAATINDSKTGVDFEITIRALPYHQFYEFTVDVVNNGNIDAKLDTFVKTTLSDAQERYLNYFVTYADNGEIKKNDLLPVGGRETLKIAVEFQRDLIELPAEETTISLSANLIYVQNDGKGVSRNKNILFNVLKDNAVMDNVASTYVTSPTGINLGEISSDTNGKGVYTWNKSATQPNPIYYYRGAVTNNNVEFGGFCWKMIRTTDTGGIKLIYNGTRQADGCTATGENASIGTSTYNSFYKDNDIKYVGYTYLDGSTQKDSTIKTKIDTWYSTNLNSYTKYLEDTPFYNERDSAIATDDSSYTLFAPYIRMYGQVSNKTSTANTSVKLSAVNPEDRYTVSSGNGNGYLQYPIGLITADEVILAGGRSHISTSDKGSNSTYYLYIARAFRTLSPGYYAGVADSGGMGVVDGPGYLSFAVSINNPSNVRPVVSLKPGITYTTGDGTPSNPYVIAQN